MSEIRRKVVDHFKPVSWSNYLTCKLECGHTETGLLRRPSGFKLGSDGVAPKTLRCRKCEKEKALSAEVRGSQALADANEARERGDLKTAERLYDESQKQLDRFNRLTGRS